MSTNSRYILLQTPKKQDNSSKEIHSTKKNEEPVDKPHKKIKIPTLNIGANDDTIFQTSKTPSNIIKTYSSNKATTQPITQSMVNYIFIVIVYFHYFNIFIVYFHQINETPLPMVVVQPYSTPKTASTMVSKDPVEGQI